MWTPFAHQPSRVQPVQARPSSNPSIFSAPSLLSWSCRGAPAASSVQRVEELPTVPLLCPIFACLCSRFCSCFFLPGLRLVGEPAIWWEVGTAQPHHSLSF